MAKKAVASTTSVPELEAHTLAALLPMMQAAEMEKLKASILTNGLQEPITLYQGKILDGRNRYSACEALGIVPTTVELGDTRTLAEAVDFVMAKNLQRRQLSKSQKAVVALKVVAEIGEELATSRINKIKEAKREKRITAGLNSSCLREELEGKNRRGRKPDTTVNKATHYAAMLLGVSTRYVEYAKKLQEKDADGLDEVFNHKLPLSKAVSKYNLSDRKPGKKKHQMNPRIALKRQIVKFLADDRPEDVLKEKLKEVVELLEKK